MVSFTAVFNLPFEETFMELFLIFKYVFEESDLQYQNSALGD